MAEGLERIYYQCDKQRQAILRLNALGHIDDITRDRLLNKLLPFLEEASNCIEEGREIDEPKSPEKFGGPRIR